MCVLCCGVRVCVCACVHTRALVYVRVYVCVHARMRVYLYICACTREYVHEYMWVCMHVIMYVRNRSTLFNLQLNVTMSSRRYFYSPVLQVPFFPPRFYPRAVITRFVRHSGVSQQTWARGAYHVIVHTIKPSALISSYNVRERTGDSLAPGRPSFYCLSLS